MEVIFGASVGLLSWVAIVNRWRASGPGDRTLWYLLSSFAFVFTGFFIDAVEAGGGVNGWAYRALVVVSLGTLAVVTGSAVAGSLSPAAGGTPVTNDLHMPSSHIATRRLLVAAFVVSVPAWAYFAFLGYVSLFDGVGAVVDQGVSSLGELQASRLSRDSYLSSGARYISLQGVMELARNVGAPLVASYSVVQLRLLGKSNVRIAIVVLCSVTILLAGQRWPLIYLGIAMLAGAASAGVRLPPRQLLGLATYVAILGLSTSLMQRQPYLGSDLPQFFEGGVAL